MSSLNCTVTNCLATTAPFELGLPVVSRLLSERSIEACDRCGVRRHIKEMAVGGVQTSRRRRFGGLSALGGVIAVELLYRIGVGRQIVQMAVGGIDRHIGGDAMMSESPTVETKGVVTNLT